MKLELIKGSEHRAPLHYKLDIDTIDITYLSSHENHEDGGTKERGPPRDDLHDLRIKVPEFDDNLKPENYIY